MAFLLTNPYFSQDLQSVLTSWHTNNDQHDLFLICNSGQRVTTRQSLLSLHSPLIRTLLDNISPFCAIPAISVSAVVTAVSGLICLLSTGNTSSGQRDDLEEVKKAAESLGVVITNCEIEDNTCDVDGNNGNNHNVYTSPIVAAVNNIEKNIPSVVQKNVVSNEIESPKKWGKIYLATSIFKTKEAKGLSKDTCLPVSKRIGSVIEKLKNKSAVKEIDQNMSTNENRLVCPICDQSFAQRNQNLLRKHCRQKHQKELRYVCQICHESFMEKSSLKRHSNRKHRNESHSIDYSLRCVSTAMCIYHPVIVEDDTRAKSYSAPKSPQPKPILRPTQDRETLPPPIKRPRPQSTVLPNSNSMVDDDDIQEVVPVKSETREPTPPLQVPAMYSPVVEEDHALASYQEEGYDDYEQYEAGDNSYDGGMTDTGVEGFAGAMMTKLKDGSGFLCLLCNKVAVTKGNLKKHIENQHMSDTPQNCSQCGKSFKNKNSLQNHMSISHRQM